MLHTLRHLRRNRWLLSISRVGRGGTIAFAEQASYPSSVLARRWPNVPNLGDATKINTDEFLHKYGRPYVVAGGVPCQPASLIGERRGTSDERWLWPDTIRIMRGLRPKFGLFENPTALLTLERGRAFNGILSGLAAERYDVLWQVIPAAAVGAGHLRERVWILATDTDCTGLERYAWHEAGGRGQGPDRPASAPNLRDRELTSEKWYAQSGIQPVVAGIPSRLARDQLTAIGNTLVPQVAHIWMKTIASTISELS